MSFLSSLLKVGGIAAAPFTGGASLIPTALSAAGDISSVLGKQQAGKSAGKVQQAQADLTHDRNAIDLYQARQSAENQAAQTDLQRKSFETSNHSKTALQGLVGKLLSGDMQATKIGPGGASGGLMASLQANPEARAAMAALGSQGASAQAAPLAFQGGQMMAAPQLSAAPQVDNGGFLATLANIGQLAGAASPYLKKKPAPMDEDPQGGLY